MGTWLIGKNYFWKNWELFQPVHMYTVHTVLNIHDFKLWSKQISWKKAHMYILFQAKSI